MKFLVLEKLPVRFIQYDTVKAAGYQAYTEPRLEHGATVFKVRVGPTPGKAEAERLRQRIEAQFEARGMLVPSR